MREKSSNTDKDLGPSREGTRGCSFNNAILCKTPTVRFLNAITETRAPPLICQQVKGLKKSEHTKYEYHETLMLNSILDILKTLFFIVRIDKSIMQIPFISIIITHEFEISKAAAANAWCPKAFSAKKKGVQPISISESRWEQHFLSPIWRLEKASN